MNRRGFCHLFGGIVPKFAWRDCKMKQKERNIRTWIPPLISKTVQSTNQTALPLCYIPGQYNIGCAKKPDGFWNLKTNFPATRRFHTDSHRVQCYLEFNWHGNLSIWVTNFFHFALKRYSVWKIVRCFWRILYTKAHGRREWFIHFDTFCIKSLMLNPIKMRTQKTNDNFSPIYWVSCDFLTHCDEDNTLLSFVVRVWRKTYDKDWWVFTYAGWLDECFPSQKRRPVQPVGRKVGPSHNTREKPTCDFVTRIYFELIHVKGKTPGGSQLCSWTLGITDGHDRNRNMCCRKVYLFSKGVRRYISNVIGLGVHLF
jgi:hypothetical protein